ncbi:hypothetical protein [uncultured Cetobacterium sp.]|uniref:hypothetical protein n=1 Tax=uncultured Cetobacterium sp. TaxID=527638 RepID=UPI002607B80C|nr:hypothetical protein [uncultured Cetobacterium sp.]
MNKETFEQISKTGRQVIILRDVGKCDCIRKEEHPVVDSDYLSILGDTDFEKVIDDIENADPNCHKCYGTGKRFFKIFSEKIRLASSSAIERGSSAEEHQKYKLLKDDAFIFYFPFNYNFLTLKDYVITLEYDKDNNIVSPIKFKNLYKIVENSENFENNFLFHKVKGKKIKEV